MHVLYSHLFFYRLRAVQTLTDPESVVFQLLDKICIFLKDYDKSGNVEEEAKSLVGVAG